MLNNLLNSEFLLRAKSTITHLSFINPFERCFSNVTVKGTEILHKSFTKLSTPILGKFSFNEGGPNFLDGLATRLPKFTANHQIPLPNLHGHLLGGFVAGGPISLPENIKNYKIVHESLIDFIEAGNLANGLFECMQEIEPVVVAKTLFARVFILTVGNALKVIYRSDNGGFAFGSKEYNYTLLIDSRGEKVDVAPTLFKAGTFGDTFSNGETPQYIHSVPIYLPATHRYAGCDVNYIAKAIKYTTSDSYMARPETIPQWSSLINQPTNPHSIAFLPNGKDGILTPYMFRSDFTSGTSVPLLDFSN